MSALVRLLVWSSTCLVTAGCPAFVENDLREVDDPSSSGGSNGVDDGGGIGNVPVAPGGAAPTGGAPPTAGVAGVAGVSVGGLGCGHDALLVTIGCPPECDDCSNGTCRIACAEKDECKEATLRCPAGYRCNVQCDGKASCANAVIFCPDDFRCDVGCSTDDACKEAQVVCTSGPCLMACGPAEKACENAVVNCGTNSCEAQCAGEAQPPNLNCGEACGCNGC